MKNIRKVVWLRFIVIFYAIVLMLRYAGDVSLWGDDLATIYFVEKGQDIYTILNRVYSDIGSNPPLFYLLAFLWVRIAPYGTFYIKLLNIIFSCLGIVFCGTVTRRIRGDRAALIVTIFAATSFYLVDYAAFSFRCYGFYFMVCSLLILAYHNRLMNPNKLSSHIWYCIMLATALYTHYYSMVIFGIMGLCDLYLFINKKIRFNCICEYIGAFVLFIPLLIIALKNMISVSTNFWAPIPNLNILLETVELVFSNQKFILLMFLSAVIIVFIYKKRQSDLILNQVMTALIAWVVFLFGFVYWFSSQEWASSVFYSRYFIAVLAPAIIVAGVGLDFILDLILEKYEKDTTVILAVIVLCLCFFNNAIDQLDSVSTFPGYVNQPVEEAIEYIYSADISHMPDSLIISNTNNEHLYYYASHNGTRENLNFGDLDLSNYQQYNNVIALTIWSGLSDDVALILEDNFDLVQTTPFNNAANVLFYQRKADVNLNE